MNVQRTSKVDVSRDSTACIAPLVNRNSTDYYSQWFLQAHHGFPSSQLVRSPYLPIVFFRDADMCPLQSPTTPSRSAISCSTISTVEHPSQSPRIPSHAVSRDGRIRRRRWWAGLRTWQREWRRSLDGHRTKERSGIRLWASLR